MNKKWNFYLIFACLLLITSIASAATPTVTSITPASGVNTTSVSITDLAGTNFASGAMVMLTPVSASPVYKGKILNGDGGALLGQPQRVVISGNYAYVVAQSLPARTDNKSLEIVDITNPANPVHKGSIVNGAGGALLDYPAGVDVSGNYAYVASYTSNALEIIDVSDPAHPSHVSSIVNGTGGALLLNAWDVHVSGDYAYVLSYGSHALEIVNISNPSSPVHEGSIQSVSLLGLPQDLFVVGNLAYITSRNANSLQIVNISNPKAPSFEGNITNGAGGAILNYPVGVFVSGNYAYVTSVINNNALEIIDVTNPKVPVHKGSIVHGSNGAILQNPVSIYISGNNAYIVNAGTSGNFYYDGSLEVIDVSDPTAPVHKSNYSTQVDERVLFDNPKSIDMSGTYAYIASSSSGALEIVDVRTVTATGVSVVLPSKITNTFNLTGKPEGLYNVVVTNPNGQFGTLSSGFTIGVGEPAAPVAAFTGTPTYGAAPLTVTFTDHSTNTPTSWNWSFGDGNFSTSKNPDHTYQSNGTYIVSLTATNAKGSNRLTKTNYIIVGNVSRIGVFRPSAHQFYLDYNGNGLWEGGAVDKLYNYFGLVGDIPVSGDWNADGRTEIGVYRPSTYLFYLDYNGNSLWEGATIDRVNNFGIPGDIPITGDWNADGRTEIGIFQNATHQFYLDYNGNGLWEGGAVDKLYNYFGLVGDIPVSGDWNSDGRTEIGVYRPSTHQFYLDYNGNGLWEGASIDRSYNFGLVGDLPVSGDWDGDWISEIGVYRPSTHQFYLDYNGNGLWEGASIDRSLNFGLIDDKPVSGKWI